ncbi:MAG TPA: glycosyltransferase family 4 protein [Flavobacterium sp.]|jgi:glycosyltransferase involved in cell wall biosynthesis
MHICFITHEYPQEGVAHGGIGSFVKTLGAGLAEAGIRVSVVGVSSGEDEEKRDGNITIYRIRKSSVRGFAWWFNSRKLNSRLAKIHAEIPIDVIETAELGLAFLKKIKGIQYVIRLHGGHHFFAQAENRGINWWKGYQEKRSFAKADAFIAVSQYVWEHTAKYLSFHNKPVVKIRYPINRVLFRPTDTQVVPNLIVFAGTICEKKGVRELIRAFSLVKQSIPDAQLKLYGRDWKFPDGSSYIEKIKVDELSKLGKTAHDITFCGPVAYAEIPEKLAESAVCVFPSHMETQGLVAPEAMAMKKTVVFTKAGPGPETITDGETGFLVDPHSPEDIAEKIIRVLQHPEESGKMAEKGALFVAEQYDLDRLTLKNIEFYRSLLHHR